MQHELLDRVLIALSTVRAGRPTPYHLGLRAVPLLSMRHDVTDALAAPVRVASDPAHLPATDSIVSWRELASPEPSRVRAGNRSEAAVVLHVGTLLDGGMSCRALTRTVAIPGRSTEVLVPVEAVGARWWPDGALHDIGPLAPAALALLLQSSLAVGATACSARTALWSLWKDELAGPEPTQGSAPRGWLLLDGAGDVLAAWIGDGPDPGAAAHVSDDPSTSGGEPDFEPGALERLRDLVAEPDLVPYLLEHNGLGGELVLLPRGLRLVDAVSAPGTIRAA